MNSQRRPLIVGNWKMSTRREDALTLAKACAKQAQAISAVEWVVCPPLGYLDSVAQAVRETPLRVGAQNVAENVDDGAYTGEVSAAMLSDLGASYVIVGHSERRLNQGESNAVVARKLAAVLSLQASANDSLTPILCVGEDWPTRESGKSWSHIENQLAAAVDAVGIALFDRVVIAYEPIWAIGTGQAASPKDAEDMLQRIRDFLAHKFTKNGATIARPAVNQGRLLYGGSVKPNNAEALFAQPNMDGALIGGASLDAGAFGEIGKTAAAVFQAQR